MQTQSSLPMLMRNVTDTIYVRASVSRICNLNCVYCAKASGMENHVAEKYKGKELSTEHYLNNLSHLARNGVQGIAFTGGEPTLNQNLPDLIIGARKLFQRVELTTNGFRLLQMFDLIAPQLDLIKISLDGIDPQLVRKFTGSSQDEVARVFAAIRESCKAGLAIAVNMVVMRSNITQIPRMIELCRNINKVGPGKVYISLLDLYFSNEKKSFWEKEFYPLGLLEEGFTRLYGAPVREEKFGCRFYWLDADGVKIRFKDSISATQRAPKCQNCKFYCQEGIYGLKHSVEGWVTTCPNNDLGHGVFLSSDMNNTDADQILSPLTSDICMARPDQYSFKKLIQFHDLKPAIPILAT